MAATTQAAQAQTTFRGYLQTSPGGHRSPLPQAGEGSVGLLESRIGRLDTRLSNQLRTTHVRWNKTPMIAELAIRMVQWTTLYLARLVWTHRAFWGSLHLRRHGFARW